MSIDLASIRAGVGNILSAIPEIKKVNLYGFQGEAVNNQPFAMIERETIQGPSITMNGEEVGDEGLGQYSHLVTFRLRVYSTFMSPQAAQQMDDIIGQRLLDAFNASTARLIDPNGPGVVDNSRLSMITPFMVDDDHAPYWVTEAVLMIKVIAAT